MSYFDLNWFSPYPTGRYRHHIQRYGLATVTPPANEPVTLGDLKLFLRIDGDNEDALLNSYITAGRILAEQTTNRCFCSQTLALYLDDFEAMKDIPLPGNPIQSITSVQYVSDPSGALTTLSPSIYMLDNTQNEGLLRLQYLQDWPTARIQPQSVIVTYVAGYSADGTSVPEGIKTAIKLTIGQWYQNREDAEGLSTNCKASDALLSSYRIWMA